MTVHASPTYRIRPAGPPPPGYPTGRDAQEPGTLGSSFDTRRAAYMAHCLATPAPENTKGIYHELVRLAASGEAAPPPIHEGVIAATLDYIDARHDCADFSLHGVLRLLYQFGDHPALSPTLVERCRQTVLAFKYWPDEPGTDSMCTWTENHHILFASAAYLAGQMFPEATFSNSGRTGAEQMALSRPRIRRWLYLRFRTGFSEWLSHVYYDEDLTALLSLVDFCADAEIASRAAMVIDLLLLDIVLNSHRGVFGSSHGRAYENTKKWAGQEGTTDTAKLLFGQGQWSGFDNMSAAAFCLSASYRVPAAIEAVARDAGRAPMENRQRMGIRLAEASRWGLGTEDFEDGMALLTLEAYLHPLTVGLVMRMFDAFNWWDNAFFAPFKPYRRLIGVLRRTRTLPLLSRLLEWDLCRNTREEVNVLTCRTPDYMLSCAQDYRPGYGGDQQHIWQATLGPDAVGFTTHPPCLSEENSHRPGFWHGNVVLPRVAQWKDVLIAVHRLPADDWLGFTHAYFPLWAFDERRLSNAAKGRQWAFAAKGAGYLALTAARGFELITRGNNAYRELRSSGHDNVWVCHMGRAALDGDFKAFQEKISGLDMDFGELSVRCTTLRGDSLAFGWEGAFMRNGEAVPLSGFKHYENPYCTADMPARDLEVRYGDTAMKLNFKAA